MKVDEWKEVEVVNEETGIDEIKDICNDNYEMEEKEDEKYLGDLISLDGRNVKPEWQRAQE